jgi:hypothetical protein
MTRFLILSGLVVASACSAAGDGFGPGSSGLGSGGSGGGSGDSGAGSGNAGTGSGGDYLGFGGDLGDDVGKDDCGGETYASEGRPLAIYIMMDRSLSMNIPFIGPNIWAPVGTALGNFVVSPQASGISAGIQFFPLRGNEDSCSVADYAVPAAPIGPLPQNGAAIQQAILNNPPGGYTPTRPALEGAIQYVRGWVQQNLGFKAVVILATDGQPNECESSIQSVSEVAAAGLTGNPPVETYVVGIGNLQGMNDIARAGGTGQALVVDFDPNVAEAQFQTAMESIRDRAIPCDYSIPEQGRSDPTRVNIKITSGGAETIIPNVQTGDRCGTEGGWYWDADPPQRAVLCPATCSAAAIGVGVQVRVVVGCQQIVR